LAFLFVAAFAPATVKNADLPALPAALWDSPRHRNLRPVDMSTNGEIQAFLERFFWDNHRDVQRRMPAQQNLNVLQWTEEDNRLSTVFIEGFLEAAERDTFFRSLPFNLTFVEEILSTFRFHFAVSIGGTTRVQQREVLVSLDLYERFENFAGTMFTENVLIQIATVFGLGPNIRPIFEAELHNPNRLFVWGRQMGWANCPHMGNVLLIRAGRVAFWRAAFSCSHTFAGLWDAHMLDIVSYNDMQMARTVVDRVTLNPGISVRLVGMVEQYVDLRAPVINAVEFFVFYDYLGRFIWFGVDNIRNFNNEPRPVIEVITTYFIASYKWADTNWQSAYIIAEATQMIRQLAEVGWRHGGLSINTTVADNVLLIYMNCELMDFPSIRPFRQSATVIWVTVGSLVNGIGEAYVVGGQYRIISQTTVTGDVVPFIVGDRTMVPLRSIAEALGAEVDWDEATNTVIMVLDGITIYLAVGVPLPGNMGTPVIVDERTFVPVRYISEAFGATVRWAEESQTVFIYQRHN